MNSFTGATEAFPALLKMGKSVLVFSTYFIHKDPNTSVHCQTGLCNFIPHLIPTGRSQRNSTASEVVSPQFEL